MFLFSIVHNAGRLRHAHVINTNDPTASVACRILATESDICIKNSVRILYICCNSVCVNDVMDPRISAFIS